MTVSLVKITPDTVVYTVGHNLGGYSPDPDHVMVAATIDDARAILAGELDRLADFLADTEIADDDTEELDSLSADVEYVKSDPDGDVAWAIQRHGGWSTAADGEVYWIQASTLGEAFGDDTESDEYLDAVDALLSV